MTISIMDRLALGKELSELMLEQKTAAVLRRVALGKQILEVMLKLGLGAASQPGPVPEPEQQPQPTEETPQVVKDFLAGAFVALSQMEFIDKLREISEFVGTYLTLDQAKEQTVSWVEKAGLSI